MPLRTRSLPSTDELAHLRGLSAFLPVNILHTMGERSASTIAIERNGEPGDAQHNGGFIRFSSHETTWRTSAASEGRRQPEQGERFATGVEQIMGGARPRDWGFDFRIAQR